MTRNFLSLVVVSFVCVTSVTYTYADDLPERCMHECVSNFGEKLGESFTGVQAYSNCQNACVNPTPNLVAKVYTGIKWQCVEYARRWLLVNEGVVYGDVDIAADIWDLEFVHTPDKDKRFTFQGFVNGSLQTPRRGDLLIYASAFYGTGHVAVVLQVDAQQKLMFVGEQNFDNNEWQHQYARAISYIVRENGTWLLDPYIIGWKRVIY